MNDAQQVGPFRQDGDLAVPGPLADPTAAGGRVGGAMVPRDTGDLAHVEQALRADTDDGDASNALAGGADQGDIDGAGMAPGRPITGDLG